MLAELSLTGLIIIIMETETMPVIKLDAPVLCQGKDGAGNACVRQTKTLYTDKHGDKLCFWCWTFKSNYAPAKVQLSEVEPKSAKDEEQVTRPAKEPSKSASYIKAEQLFAAGTMPKEEFDKFVATAAVDAKKARKMLRKYVKED